jgi:hypothetical protein
VEKTHGTVSKHEIRPTVVTGGVAAEDAGRLGFGIYFPIHGGGPHNSVRVAGVDDHDCVRCAVCDVAQFLGCRTRENCRLAAWRQVARLSLAAEMTTFETRDPKNDLSGLDHRITAHSGLAAGWWADRM